MDQLVSPLPTCKDPSFCESVDIDEEAFYNKLNNNKIVGGTSKKTQELQDLISAISLISRRSSPSNWQIANQITMR